MISDKLPELLMNGTGVIDTRRVLAQAASLIKLAQKGGLGHGEEANATVYALENMLKHVTNDLSIRD